MCNMKQQRDNRRARKKIPVPANMYILCYVCMCIVGFELAYVCAKLNLIFQEDGDSHKNFANGQRCSLKMANPTETEAEAKGNVSPPKIKRVHFEYEGPTRRAARRMTEATENPKEEESKEISEEEEAMVKIVITDLLSDNEDTLEQAMNRLAKYLYDDDDEKIAKKQEAFTQVGGHFFVVSIMKKHPNCKMLQNNGIWVLMNATYKNSFIGTAVAKVEGIQAILTAMKTFPTDAGVIGKGFAALFNIVFEHEANADILVMKLGEVPFLVERMKEFEADRGVLVDACDLMLHLSDVVQLREPMVSGKVITALVSAIEIHRGDADIQKSAREALVALLKDDLD